MYIYVQARTYMYMILVQGGLLTEDVLVSFPPDCLANADRLLIWPVLKPSDGFETKQPALTRAGPIELPTPPLAHFKAGLAGYKAILLS